MNKQQRVAAGWVGGVLALSGLVHAGSAQGSEPVKAPEKRAEEKKTPGFALPSVLDGQPRPMELLRADAARLLGFVKTQGAKRYLLATNSAPIIEQARVVHWNRATRDALTPEQFAALPPEKREGYDELSLDEGFYYHTLYGSPHAYARAIDLACENLPGGDAKTTQPGKPAPDCFKPGMRVLDYGFGGIVHLRLLAGLGMDVHGIEVDPLLKAFYREASDTGEMSAWGNDTPGKLAIHFGSWPKDEALRSAVGAGYNVIFSKNTLKRGYVNPPKEWREKLSPKMLIDLGVEQGEFLKAIHDALAPGGILIIYNICPAQKKPEEGYIPWADGKSPWTAEEYKRAGLEVVHLDVDDTERCRVMGVALEWDQKGMDLKNDLFAWYTIVRRPVVEVK